MMPGIVKIGWLRAVDLPDLLLPVPGVHADAILEKVQWLHLNDVGTLSEEADYSEFCLKVKTSLDFVSHQEVPVDVRVGFVVVDALGDSYIVGCAPPHCGALRRTAQINEPSGKASSFYYSFNIPVPRFKL